MIRFIDLDNGAIYNGDAPYIHWFEDEQSINLNYVKKICVICDDEYINIRLNNNAIFSLLNLDNLSQVYNENINDFSYKDIEKLRTNNISSKGYLYKVDYQCSYLHMIYVLAYCKQEGEYLEDLYINNERFILGSSFYDKYEPHKINLSNLGVEIPESVVRAIYNSNVHEEEVDNIIINRKYKELLNEYWNIIANKGSYKSLYNSISWFEYGDLIKLQELWENTDNYNQQDIKSYLDKRIEDYLLKHKKTTYLGLYLPLQQMSLDENGNIVYPPIVEDINYQSGDEDKLFTNAILNNPIGDEDSYDDQIFEINGDSVAINNSYGEDSEYFDHSDWRRISLSDYNGFIREENPELMNICSKWSNEDLSLKMYLVGNFFETYFMPIHLDLIHSTIENVVFTNTIKIIQESRINRTDYINNFFTFKCNVNDNDIFFLEDISARVNKDTIAGTQWNENIKYYETQYKDGIKHYNDSIYILGVDDNIDRIADDNDLKTFLSQYYNGIGKVVNFICDVDIQTDDFIRQLNISLTRENEVVSNKFKLLSQKNQSKNIKFNILCKQEGDYKINIEFITANQFNYVKTIHFSILDNTSKNIKVYKVKYNTLSEHEDSNRYQTVSNYMFSHHRNYEKNTPMRFFIPEYLQNVDTSVLDGVRMNRTIIVEGDISIENVIAESNIRDNTKVLKRRNIQTQEVSYTIFILPVDTPADFQPIVDKKLLVRNDLVFYPENHHLEEIATSDNVTIDDYTFTQKDVLMVISNSKYLKYIEDPEWEFENVSRKNKSKPITLKSIQTPFIANVNYKLLDPGFYNVKFRYKLGQSIQEVSLDSAFRIV